MNSKEEIQVTLTIMISAIVIFAIFPFLFMWLYQRQQAKDLERAMSYLKHSAIQYHKEEKSNPSSQPTFATKKAS